MVWSVLLLTGPRAKPVGSTQPNMSPLSFIHETIRTPYNEKYIHPSFCPCPFRASIFDLVSEPGMFIRSLYIRYRSSALNVAEPTLSIAKTVSATTILFLKVSVIF
jgi:hypothetical protein